MYLIINKHIYYENTQRIPKTLKPLTLNTCVLSRSLGIFRRKKILKHYNINIDRYKIFDDHIISVTS